MTKTLSKKYKHHDYADFEIISDMFNEHRIHKCMYNRYIKLEIYMTGK
jgi:hypothetical protein